MGERSGTISRLPALQNANNCKCSAAVTSTSTPPLLSDPPAGSAAAQPLPRLRGPGGRPWRALLADDNPVNLEIGVALLQQLGLSVATACDGVEAVQLAGAGGFDLVLMDIQMPRLDGLGATRSIRALPGGDRLPVIAVTANSVDGTLGECLAAGMNDVLSKPVDLHQLAVALARWLPSGEP